MKRFKKEKFSSLKPHHLFFLLMGMSSAISIVKSGALAAVFSPEDFSRYSAAFALIALLASMTSFGLVEGTVKRFTRLIAYGRTAELRSALSHDLTRLLGRHCLSLVIVLAILVYFGEAWLLPSVSVVLMAFATNLFSVSGSLFRGYDWLIGLGSTAVLRATAALLLSTGLGYVFGWQIGFLAESVSAAVIGAAAIWYLQSTIKTTPPHLDPNIDGFVSGKSDGFWLFLAFGTALLPVSIDRAWLVQFASQRVAAQYAFCGIWMLSAYTVTSIYVQKFGPDMVRAQALTSASKSLWRTFQHSIALSLILIAGATAAFVVIYLFFHATFWQRYDLSVFIASATVAAVAMQVSQLFDWALIAEDGEHYAFVASALFATVFMSLFIVCTYNDAEAAFFIIAAAVARLSQIVLSLLFIRHIERSHAR